MKTFLKYGISEDISADIIAAGFSVSSLRKLKLSIIAEKLDIPLEKIKNTRSKLRRKPIVEDTMFTLLENSNYTCCCCKGLKSTSFIIHHIVPYNETQNNDYNNLAVLCPACHDYAHMKQGLSQKITPEQIQKSKYKWEKEVEKHNVEKASLNFEFAHIDFINIPRISELSQETQRNTIHTRYSDQLKKLRLLDEGGKLDMQMLSCCNRQTRFPFDFINAGLIILHYSEIFKYLAKDYNFSNLENYLNKKSIISPEILGKFVYYVGGLYGVSPEIPITETSKPTHLYLQRKPFFVEWLLDPKYLTTNTSICRLGERSIYLIYGQIRNVGTITRNSKNYVHIDVRPYLVTQPTKIIDRTPLIAYKRQFNDIDWDSSDDLEEYDDT
jgi:5-methylcytosine-specific restriction endonuclease McrA